MNKYMTRRGETQGNQNVVIKNRHCRESLSAISTAFNNQKGGDPRLQASGMTTLWNGGFTLIELLVVVLIIGILAAVAVPQYQKAVWKSRNAQLKTLVSTVGKAQQAYRMANGKNAYDFDELNIDLPLTSSIGQECGMAYHTNSGRQGNNFEIQLYNGQVPVVGWWTSGPYKCGGFAYNRDGEMFCVERLTYITGKTGSFCSTVEKASLSSEVTDLYKDSYWSRFYTLH